MSGAAMSIMYHDGNRQLQDRFESRRIADPLEEKLTRRFPTPCVRARATQREKWPKAAQNPA
jgi:hypothetical protein